LAKSEQNRSVVSGDHERLVAIGREQFSLSPAHVVIGRLELNERSGSIGPKRFDPELVSLAVGWYGENG